MAGIGLQELVVLYQADRAAIDREHPPIVPSSPAAVDQKCRYCGKRWQNWPGARFDGHVRCAVSKHFMQQLVLVLEDDPSITFKRISEAIGVTPSVANAWWRHAKNIAWDGSSKGTAAR